MAKRLHFGQRDVNRVCTSYGKHLQRQQSALLYFSVDWNVDMMAGVRAAVLYTEGKTDEDSRVTRYKEHEVSTLHRSMRERNKLLKPLLFWHLGFS